MRETLRIPFEPLKRAGEGSKLEQAKSGRAKCRWCGKKIEKGAWRLGVPYEVPQSSSGRVSFAWWHLECALSGARDALRVALEGDFGFDDAPEWRMRVKREELKS